MKWIRRILRRILLDRDELEMLNMYEEVRPRKRAVETWSYIRPRSNYFVQ